MNRQVGLVERLRRLLRTEPTTREVSMFGGRAFMVNDRMVVSAGKDGGLLVRVPADRHDSLTTRPGAAQARMGADRDMGSGWIAVTAATVADDTELSFWLGVALDHNRARRRVR